jgi:hypothetical protein
MKDILVRDMQVGDNNQYIFVDKIVGILKEKVIVGNSGPHEDPSFQLVFEYNNVITVHNNIDWQNKYKYIE